MKTSTQIHLTTIAAVAGVIAFVVVCIIRPIVLLFVVGSIVFVFLYGTLYIFVSSRFVQAKRRRREERMARELKLRADFGLAFRPLSGDETITDVNKGKALRDRPVEERPNPIASEAPEPNANVEESADSQPTPLEPPERE